MQIRKAEEGDASALVGLMAELGYSHTIESIKENMKGVENRGGSVFVAVLNGSVLGCICAIIDVRLAGGECGEIVSVIVAQEHRGKGIGKKLIKHAEAWLGTKTGSIRIRANALRQEAHEFYKSLGYEEEKTQTIFKKNLL